MLGIVREVLTLLVDTLRRPPRPRCTCPPSMRAIGGFRRGCPVHEARYAR